MWLLFEYDANTNTSGYYSMASMLLQVWLFFLFFSLVSWRLFSPFPFFFTILGFSFWHSNNFGCEYPFYFHNQLRLECFQISSSFQITDLFSEGFFCLTFYFASHSGTGNPSQVKPFTNHHYPNMQLNPWCFTTWNHWIDIFFLFCCSASQKEEKAVSF